ncbi:MAG: hypothetical protein HYX69_18650 [Planctomycetia bacterium]|nr:hypothetical protein [Planctomycetia bacterium]
MTTGHEGAEYFRVWIADCPAWEPRSWRDLPRQALAVEVAEPACLSADDALAYVQGHNTAALAHKDRRWAVAIPVVIVYEGEPAEGDVIFPRQIGELLQ